MSITCPKCGHTRDKIDQSCPDWQCPKCGVVYEKAAKRLEAQKSAVVDEASKTTVEESKPEIINSNSNSEEAKQSTITHKKKGGCLQIGCLTVVLFFGAIVLIGKNGSMQPQRPVENNAAPINKQEWQKPITYSIDKSDVNEFKQAYYYTITLNVEEGRKPTLEEINGIFNGMLKPNMEKLSLFIMLPKMGKNAGAYASCLKTKFGDKSCRINQVYNEQGGDKIKQQTLKIVGKEVDWCALSEQLSKDYLDAIHYADSTVPPPITTEKQGNAHKEVMDKKRLELEEKTFKKFEITRAQYNALWIELNGACNY